MSITVFIADDHAMMRDGLKYMLAPQRDIKVVGEAANGLEAVQQVTRLRPDVVIMDITMPYLNGLEAAGRLAELQPSVKVIILSMHRAPEYISRAFQAGARGYLLKEAASEELLEAVRRVYAGERYLSRAILDQVVDSFLAPTGPAGADPLAGLTSREREVFLLVVAGKTTAQISDLLALSPKTVKTYRSRIMAKLKVANLAELVKFAVQHGLA